MREVPGCDCLQLRRRQSHQDSDDTAAPCQAAGSALRAWPRDVSLLAGYRCIACGLAWVSTREEAPMA